MNIYDFIVDPSTGKKVSIHSSIGQYIIRQYNQIGGGDTAMKDDIKTDIHETISDNIAQIQSVSPTVSDIGISANKIFLEGETVKVSNTIGVVVDPSKLNRETLIYENADPDNIDQSVRNRHFVGSLKDVYSKNIGQQYRLAHFFNRNGEEMSPEWVQDLIRPINDYVLTRKTFTYNKSSNHPKDISVISSSNLYISKPNYFVEFNKDNQTFVSVLSAEYIGIETESDVESQDSEDSFLLGFDEEINESELDFDESSISADTQSDDNLDFEDPDDTDMQIQNAHRPLSDEYTILDKIQERGSIITKLKLLPYKWESATNLLEYQRILEERITKDIIDNADRLGIEADINLEPIVTIDEWDRIVDSIETEDGAILSYKDYEQYLIDASFLNIIKDVNLLLADQHSNDEIWELFNDFFSSPLYSGDHFDKLADDLMCKFIEQKYSNGKRVVYLDPAIGDITTYRENPSIFKLALVIKFHCRTDTYTILRQDTLTDWNIVEGIPSSHLTTELLPVNFLDDDSDDDSDSESEDESSDDSDSESEDESNYDSDSESGGESDGEESGDDSDSESGGESEVIPVNTSGYLSPDQSILPNTDSIVSPDRVDRTSILRNLITPRNIISDLILQQPQNVNPEENVENDQSDDLSQSIIDADSNFSELSNSTNSDDEYPQGQG